MKNQLLKGVVEEFEPFIKKHCMQEEKKYIVDVNTFKKISYEDELTDFIDILKKYYYKNKFYYLDESSMTYNRFSTIIRQVCKNNDVAYIRDVKYIMSKYTVSYKISFDS